MKAAYQLLRKQELERKELLQQSNEPDILGEDHNTTVQFTRKIFSAIKRVRSQQVASC